MAIYYDPEIPQSAQSVNIGQFGPSYDSLQDWRSVWIAFNQLKDYLENFEVLGEDITALKKEALEALAAAEKALAVTEEINNTILAGVQEMWLQIVAAKEDAEEAAQDADTDADVAQDASAAATTAQETTKVLVDEAEDLLVEMKDIRDDVTHLTVSTQDISQDEPSKAEFNPVNNHLKLFIPTRDSSGTGGKIISVNGHTEEHIVLDAGDVGAFPIDGSVPVTAPIRFAVDGHPSVEYHLKVEHKTGGQCEFKLLYNNNPRDGLVISPDGDSAFGGRLFVKNKNSAEKKEVLYQGMPIGDMGIDAYSKSETYSRIEADSKFRTINDSYDKTNVDTLLEAKLSKGPSGPATYVWSNGNWQQLTTNMSDLESKLNSIPALEARIAALEAKIPGKLTISTSQPAAATGENGDIWFSYNAVRTKD